MELILKSDNPHSLAKIIALAEKLNILVEKKDVLNDESGREKIKNRILNFKANGASPFGDAAQWEREQREDGAVSLS